MPVLPEQRAASELNAGEVRIEGLRLRQLGVGASGVPFREKELAELVVNVGVAGFQSHRRLELGLGNLGLPHGDQVFCQARCEPGRSGGISRLPP